VTTGGSIDARYGRAVAEDMDGDDLYEPRKAVVIAVLLVACAAVALASLPAAIGLGLLPERVDRFGIGLVSLAVGIGGVLGAVRLVAAAWVARLRLLARRPAGSAVTSAD